MFSALNEPSNENAKKNNLLVTEYEIKHENERRKQMRLEQVHTVLMYLFPNFLE